MLYKAILISCILLFSACSIFTGTDPSSSSSLVDQKKPNLPFTLEVADEINDGERLHILGTVSALTDWSLKDVIVKLSSLSEGRPVGVSYLPLSKTKKELSGTIKANEKYQFTISVPSQNISDYQLELLWGEDAKQYVASVLDGEPGNLELRSIQMETIRQPCDGTDCKLTFRASAKLYNGTNKQVIKVILGIGFLRIKTGAELDLQRQIPQNEDKIDVGDILLPPGGSREIVINFDQAIPEKELVTEDGEIKPNIRIQSFKAE
jgi:hypothetical protein